MIRLSILLTFLLFAACGGSDGPTAPGNAGGGNDSGGDDPPPANSGQTVTLNALSFSPTELTVDSGSTVVWNNASSTAHTITPDGHSQWSRVQTSSAGEALRVTFSTPGTYDYFCEFHSGMTGKIVVE